MVAGSMACTVPARGAGMQVVEVAMSEGGEMSHSGVQVEYVAAGSVSSVFPASGVVAGGTVVTLVGSGFVAGRTACKFGSAEAVAAVVMSSEEATCVAPAGTRGMSSVEVSTAGNDATAFVSAKQFVYTGEVSVVSVSPAVAFVEGGAVVSVVANGLEDGAAAWCKMGSVVVASGRSTGGVVECTGVAGIAGNMTVEVSVNGQDFTEGSGVAVELVTAMNVSGVSQMAVVSGSVVSVYGSGFSASRGVYCAIGGSSVDGSSWAYMAANTLSASVVSCTVPARGGRDGMGRCMQALE